MLDYKGKEDMELVKLSDAIILFSDNGWMQGPTTIDFLKRNFKGEKRRFLYGIVISAITREMKSLKRLRI